MLFDYMEINERYVHDHVCECIILSIKRILIASILFPFMMRRMIILLNKKCFNDDFLMLIFWNNRYIALFVLKVI